MRKLSFFLFLLLSILAGCTTTPISTTQVQWQSHQQKLEQITQFTATGKLGYISPEKRQSLNFYWKQSANLSQLKLTTFLGQTVFDLKITPQGATIKTYDNQHYSAANANQLVYELTGLHLPVNTFAKWLVGLPADADDFTLNERNTLASLDKTLAAEQWHVNYASYQDVPWNKSNIPLPQRLKLTQAKVKLNLIISNWALNE